MIRVRLAVVLAATLFATVCAQTRPLQPRTVNAQLVELHPGRPGSADVVLSWSSFSTTADVDSTDGNAAVLRYEAQVAVSGSDAWTTLSDCINGLSAVHRDRHEMQKIITRVDAGTIITAGSFRLQLSHTSTSALDMHQNTVTPPIPFDASESQVKAAIESLDVVTRVQVFRRPLDTTAHTFEWTVLFDAVDGHSDLPLLSVHSQWISAPYSGPGDQVAVHSVREGAVDDVVCETECQFVAVDQPVATHLSFRLRAMLATTGWTDWSTVSEPLRIPPTPLPRPPSSPELLSTSATQINLRWAIHEDDAALFPVISFHLQQRCGVELSWRTVHRAVPRISRLPSATASSAGPLLPNTTCVFRMAAINANGEGAFSATSVEMATRPVEPTPPRRLRVLRDPLRLAWDPPASSGGAEILSYSLELKQFYSTTWVQEPLTEEEIQRRLHPLPSSSPSSSPLSPFTRYSARIRAKNAVGWSAFTDEVDFLTDFVAVNEAVSSSKGSGGEHQLPSSAASAHRHQVAGINNINYVHGVGGGGEGRGEDGEPGAVLLFLITADGARLEEQDFFFTGRPQNMNIPMAERQVVAVDVYAWGGGGGSGGKVAWGTGGGGAFVRGVFRVEGGDSVQVRVGGGGSGFTSGGRGGWNGGGDGGSGTFPGGGGGGSSDVKINGKLLIIAAGGGGGGSSDYCCAHGGGGGGGESQAESGLHPDASSIPLDNSITGVPRNEYHSVNVEGDTRDETGLPARHVHLDYGRASSSADYTVLAKGGEGASSTQPGEGGTAASYVVSRAGELLVDADSGSLRVDASFAGSVATPGRLGLGGRGQDGHDCGGGGGGGFFGGGGGGAGIDGAGGGGGSSFVSVDDLFVASTRPPLGPPHDPQGVHNFTAIPTSSTAIRLSWSPPPLGFSRPPEAIVVEMATRSANEDFRVKRMLDSGVWSVLVDQLRPAWIYRFRIKPLFRDATIGAYSAILTVSTPPAPRNLWTRVSGLRSLDERTIHAGARAQDVLPLLRLPSARRGHSFTAFDDGFVYLFGGFTTGYACNVGHKAACITSNGASNELWRLDTKSRTWIQIRPLGGPPPAREKHSMAVVSSHLLLFGGRHGGVDDAVAALNDLWSLKISSTTQRTTATLRDRESNLQIRDGKELFTIGNVGHTPDMCVAEMVVTVTVTHACPHTLRIELLGPGPSTHPQRQQGTASPIDSQAVETTWSDPMGFGTGQRRATPTAPSTRSFPVTLQRPEMTADGTTCATTAAQKTFTFSSTSSTISRPLEQLATFLQLSARGAWTLSVTDTVTDGNSGTLDSWDISFTLVPCVPSFTWAAVTTSGTPPSTRFQHTAIVFQSSMYVFGGRSGSGARPLTDLHRLDYTASIDSGVWTTLLPVTTYRDKVYYHGRTMLLTPFDLIAVGTGLRTRHTASQPHLLDSSSTYIGRKSVVEALASWTTVHTEVVTVDGDASPPQGRYWSSAVYVCSPAPRILMFGGQDDTALHGDLWQVEVAHMAETDPVDSLDKRRLETCAWRLGNPVFQQTWSKSCGATTAMVTGSTATECSLDMLLLYAWCGQFYQTMTL